MADLSVIIPARNEEFLAQTIMSVLRNIKGDTEVIVVCDGNWPSPPVKDHDRVVLIHHSESIGQRAAVNEAAKFSRAKFIMKLDAHCSLDKGFDIKLMANCEYNWTVLPRMYVLDAFHWVCQQCGKEHDQGPERTVCDVCGDGAKFERKIIWKRKKRKRTDYMWFDGDLRIKYFDKISLKAYGDVAALKKQCSHKSKDWAQGDITDVMCGIGACWFQYRDRYWELGGLDEEHGSWGQVAVEVAMKAWLSGGRHVVNKKTWFAHLPRTQPGFNWPYPLPARDVEKARAHSKAIWLNNQWPRRKYDLNWLIEKFGPLPGWKTTTKRSVSNPTKGVVYYTDNRCEERIANVVRTRVKNICSGFPIISVSHYPIDFGTNIVMPLPRCSASMFKQILAGLEASTADVIFLIEHDVLYHPTHFDFMPPKHNRFYYNRNRWAVCSQTGQALFYYTKCTSHLAAYRELLLQHFRELFALIEQRGHSRRKMGFAPGTHRFNGVTFHGSAHYWSKHPNIDIRHSNNFTPNRFKREQFSNRAQKGWTLADEVPSWGKTKGRFDEFLFEVASDRT